jgi:hypothetical protein
LKEKVETLEKKEYITPSIQELNVKKTLGTGTGDPENIFDDDGPSSHQ